MRVCWLARVRTTDDICPPSFPFDPSDPPLPSFHGPRILLALLPYHAWTFEVGFAPTSSILNHLSISIII